jgi:glyoxalase family protein
MLDKVKDIQAIYFRTPGDVLFEIANELGFDRHEDIAHLGEALKLPAGTRICAPILKSTCSRSAIEEAR